MLVGKTREEASSLRDRYLAAYEKAINPIQGRVSADYRKRVCINLIGDFLDTHLSEKVTIQTCPAFFPNSTHF
jgi:hypothetical protein